MLNRILRTWLQVLIPAVTLTACNVQETPVPELRVLGEPPGVATLGAEYFYEWAVDGGKGIPDFTLTNAPRWLSVEWVENSFRRGIVMRGVPGITGGRKGTGDVTQDSDDTTIVLSVTDGDQLVTRSFAIAVQENVISGVAAEVDEDTDMERPTDENGNPIPVCESQQDSGTGEWNWINSEGEPPAAASYETLGYLLLQLKDAPVEPVTFHFQRYVNAFETATGGAVDASDVISPADADYRMRSGYITFKPGMTRCLVTTMVFKDTRAEPAEVFGYEIDAVVDGLGSIGDLATPSVLMTIQDDEPRVKFTETTISGTEGTTLEIRATLNKAPETSVEAGFSVSSSDTTADADDYVIMGAPSNKVSFAAGETEKTFSIQLADTDDSSKDQDEKLVLKWDACAPGLTLTACSDESDATLTVWINEWLNVLALNWTDDGVVADTAVDSWGRVYVARNFTRSNGKSGAEVLIFDRTGASTPAQVLPFAGGDDRFDARIGALHLKALSGTGKPKQAVYVVGSANAHFTSLPSGSAPTLGGWDAVAERYDRVTPTTPLSLAWRVQYGSDQDDIATGAATDLNDNLYVVGNTGGSMEDATNNGGQDGFVLYLTASGAFTYAVNVGTAGDDSLAEAQPDNSNAVAFVGYSTGDLDDGPIGGRDAITGSYNVEGRVVRLDQFGSVVNDELLAMTRLSNGYVTAGYTQGSMFEGKVGNGGQDIVLAYHKTTSFPNKIVQLGTSGNDRGLTAGSIDLEAYVGGETGGALVSGTSLSGAKDGWYARYTADPTEKELTQVWIRQTGRAGDDKVVGMLPTQQNKVFVVNEVEGDTGSTVYIWPITPEGNDLVP